jgi:DNA invertase Pin-like site-specific DNA recombinase
MSTARRASSMIGTGWRAMVQSLTKRGIRIEFVKENLSFTGEDSPMANLMLSVMGAFAEFERTLNCITPSLKWR